MRRFIPRTLLGQTLLVLALGLMVGQVISASLLYRAAEQRRELTIANDLALRFVNADRREADAEDRRARRAARREERGLPPDRPARRGGRNERERKESRAGVQYSDASPMQSGDDRLHAIEPMLRDALAAQGIEVSDIYVARRLAGSDSFVAQNRRLRERLRGDNWQSRRIAVAGIKRADSEQWKVARIVYRERPRQAFYNLVFQTGVIFIVLLALLYLMLRRITRPLASLTERVETFSRNPDRPLPLAESGPSDTRQLIAAHNTMQARVAALLDEKDVMLGAIGHDLKTPLAALRVRIESVEDDSQRARMAESIEDITHTLDDILSLARIGRSGVQAERVDLCALTASVAEEFEDLGKPVTLGDNPRAIREVQVTWLKRAVRNLVSNAVRYGKSAHISLVEEGAATILRVDDKGPGIPADKIADMLEPFKRGEASRNRATGGAGLGLTVARAVAEQHGGELRLSNRAEGGLRAEIRLP